MSCLRALVLAVALACFAHASAASQIGTGTEPPPNPTSATPHWLRSLEIGLVFVGDEGVVVYFDSLSLALGATPLAECSFTPGIPRSVLFTATYSF